MKDMVGLLTKKDSSSSNQLTNATTTSIFTKLAARTSLARDSTNSPCVSTSALTCSIPCFFKIFLSFSRLNLGYQLDFTLIMECINLAGFMQGAASRKYLQPIGMLICSQSLQSYYSWHQKHWMTLILEMSPSLLHAS